MKALKLIALFFFCVSSLAQAKWAPLNLKSLEKFSDTIVIVEFVEETRRVQTGKRVDQTVKLKVLTSIKGEAKSELMVSGSMNAAICKPQFIFPTTKSAKYLLFLRKGKNGLSLVNGKPSVFEITKGKVTWFVDEAKAYPRKSLELAVAIKAIEKAMRQAKD